MKYVLINSWCKKGSTGNIVYNFYQYLIQHGHEVYFFHGRDNEQTDKKIVRMTSENRVKLHAGLARITGYQGFYSSKETIRLINFIKLFDPDYVYLFNLHGYYINEFMLLEYLKSRNQKTIYMLFDEYPYLGKCCFSENCDKFQTECLNCQKLKEYPCSLFFDRSNYIFNRKKQIYTGWQNLIFAGVEYIKRQAQLSILAKNIKYVSFDMGVDLDEIYYPRDISSMQNQLGVNKNNTIILTVGFSSDRRKGINKFIELSKMFDSKTVFVAIGYDRKIVKKLPSNFIPIKYIADLNEMAKYYSLADIFVSTSSGEAMSNACLEAMGCGTPIIAFDISGMPYLGKPPILNLVPYNDLDMMKRLIIHYGHKKKGNSEDCRNYALTRYNKQDFMKHLYEAVNYIGEVVDR